MDPQFQQSMQELQEGVKELHEQVKEMNRNLGLYRWIKPTVEELIRDGHKWEKCRPWHPVKDIHGKWHWREEVYRIKGNTYVDYDNWTWYRYGTILDVLRTSE